MDKLFYKVIHNKYIFNIIISNISNDSNFNRELVIGLKYYNIVNLIQMIKNNFWALLKDKLENNKFIYIDSKSIFSLIEKCKDKEIWKLIYENRNKIINQVLFDPIPISIYFNNQISLKLYLNDLSIPIFNTTLFMIIENFNNINEIYKSLISQQLSTSPHTQQQQPSTPNNLIYKTIYNIFKIRPNQFNKFELIQLLISIINNDNNFKDVEKTINLIINKINNLSTSPDILNKNCNNKNEKLIIINFKKLINIKSISIKIELLQIIKENLNKISFIIDKSPQSSPTQQQQPLKLIDSLIEINQNENINLQYLFYIEIWYLIKFEKEFNEIDIISKDNEKVLLEYLISITDSNYFHLIYLKNYLFKENYDNHELLFKNGNLISILYFTIKSFNSNLLNFIINNQSIQNKISNLSKEVIIESFKLLDEKQEQQEQKEIEDNELLNFFNLLLNIKDKYLIELIDWKNLILNCSFQILESLIKSFNNKYKEIIIKSIIQFDLVNLITQSSNSNYFSNKLKLILSNLRNKSHLNNNNSIVSNFKQIIDSNEYVDYLFEINKEFFNKFPKPIIDWCGNIFKYLKFSNLEILNYFIQQLKSNLNIIPNQLLFEQFHHYLFQISISNCDLISIQKIDYYNFKFESIDLFHKFNQDNNNNNNNNNLKFHFNNNINHNQIISLFNYLNESNFKSFTNSSFNELIISIINYDKQQKEESIFLNEKFYINFNLFPNISTTLFEHSILTMNLNLLKFIFNCKVEKEIKFTQSFFDLLYENCIIDYSNKSSSNKSSANSTSTTSCSIKYQLFNFKIIIEIIEYLIQERFKLFGTIEENELNRDQEINLFNNLFNILIGLKETPAPFLKVVEIYNLIFKENNIQLLNCQDNFQLKEYRILNILKSISFEFYNYIKNGSKISSNQQFINIFSVENLMEDPKICFNQLFSMFMDLEIEQHIASPQNKKQYCVSIYIQHLIFLLGKRQIELAIKFIIMINTYNGTTTTNSQFELETMISCSNSGEQIEAILNSPIVSKVYKEMSLILSLAIKTSNFFLFDFLFEKYKDSYTVPLPLRNYTLFNDISMVCFLLGGECKSKCIELIDLNYYFKLQPTDFDENLILEQIFVDTKQDLLSLSFEEGYTFIIDTFLKLNPDKNLVFQNIFQLFNDNRLNLLSYYYNLIDDKNLKLSLDLKLSENKFYSNFSLKENKIIK